MATQNLIQIKRSETTATPSSLANGELAFSGNSEVLFIGNFGSVLAIGGQRVPGTLTANQALVANSTSGIDKIISANVVPNKIYANGSFGSAGQILASAGSSANAYWVDAAAGTLADLDDTNITSPANGAILFWDNPNSEWIDNALSGDATILNTGVLTLATVNDDAGTYGDANSVPVITINAKGLITNASSIDINHDTLANFVSDEHVAHSGVTLTAGNGLTGGGTIAASRSFAVGAANGITVSADAVAVDGANGISVTAAGVNIDVGNTQLVSNTTGLWLTESNINHDNLSGFVSNEHVNHTSVTLTAGNGLTGGGDISASRSFAVGAANGINVAADSVGVTGANGISVTAAGVNVDAGTGVVANSTGVHIGQPVGTTDNVTFNDLTVSGNLDINGTLTTVDTTNLAVEDPLISLARNNNAADTVDIGFFGLYDTSGSQDLYAGLFRDASDGKFKLFVDTQTAPTTTVDTGGTGYTVGTLVANLESASVAITGGTITGITDLAVADGGTGVSSFTDNGIIYGNGSSALSVTAAGTQYQVLQAGASGVPEFGSLDGGSF